MSFLECSISVFLFLLFMIVGRTNGSSGNITPMAYLTAYVDPSGHGNFSTIQSAIDSVPSNNMKWVCIYIKAGTYKYFFLSTLFIFWKNYSIQLSYLFIYDEITLCMFPLFQTRVYDTIWLLNSNKKRSNLKEIRRLI